ncbi:hypothetical protein EMCRGX_G034044 [Ephydatia muelleri]
MEENVEVFSDEQSKALDELETEVLTTGLYENVDLTLGSRITVVVAESIYAVIWWSVVSALVSTIWCWNRTSFGLELVTTFTWLSPLLLLVGALQKVIHTPLGLALLRAATTAGLLSTQLAPTALVRLALLGAGNACAMLSLCAQWWGMSGLDLHRRVYCHMLGHLLFLALRAWGTSFNPVHTSLAANKFVCGLGFLAVVYLYSNDYRTPVVKASTSERLEQVGWSLGMVGVRFGAVLFLTLCVFGDLYVLPQWAGFWVSPYPWCVGILFALLCGLVVFSYRGDLVHHISWSMVGLLSSLVLLLFTSYVCLVGGCVFAMFVASQWPLLVKKLVLFPPWRALGISMATALTLSLLLYLAQSCVSGSEGVGGRYLVVMVMVGLSLENMWARGVFKPQHTLTSLAWGGTKGGVARQKPASRLARSHALRRRLPTIEEDEEEEEEEEGGEEDEGEEGPDITFAAHTVHEEREKEMASLEKHEERQFDSKITAVALLIVAFAVWGLAHHYYHHPNPPKEWPGVFSTAMWELHIDCENNPNNAQFIEDAGLDVVAAVSATPIRSPGHDYALWLSERLNMFVEYGDVEGKMGVLIFSKHPIVEAKTLQPSWSEAVGINVSGVIAAINVSGVMVDFYCLHFEDDIVEDTQVKEMELLMAQGLPRRPTVMLAYSSAPSGCATYDRLMAEGGLKASYSFDDVSHCSIYYQDIIRVAHISLDNMQVARFRVPAHPGEADAEIMTSDSAHLSPWHHVIHKQNSHSPDLHMKAVRYFVHSNVTA